MSSSDSHRRCTQCDYDLFGTMSAGFKRCPECGCDFRKFAQSYATEEWSFATGLRRAAVSLVIRCLLSLPFVTALLDLQHWEPRPRRGFSFASLFAVVLGLAMSRKFSERAGFESAILYVAMIIATASTVLLAEWILQSFFSTGFYRSDWRVDTVMFGIVLCGATVGAMWYENR